MISIQAKAIHFILKVLMVKSWLLALALKKPPRTKGDIVPKSIKSALHVSMILVDGKQVVTMQAKQPASNKHIIYLHGGGYYLEAAIMHWKLIQRIIETTGFRVTLLDYPLAPESDYRKSHAMIHQAFEQLCQKYPDDQFYLMGDSAGGGLSLALLQSLRAKGVERIPQKTVLLSPWLDASMTNPKIPELEKFDLLLSTSALQKAAMLYANGADLKSPPLSPLYGDMQNLGKIALFIGGDETFVADCRILKEKIEKTNTELQYFEYPHMQHVWVILPIPEAKKAFQQACDFLQN